MLYGFKPETFKIVLSQFVVECCFQCVNVATLLEDETLELTTYLIGVEVAHVAAEKILRSVELLAVLE
jgi:hypothetical protein